MTFSEGRTKQADVYNQIASEVRKLHAQIKKTRDSGSELSAKIEKVFQGTKILYSPLVYEPQILFVGINPGAGHLYDSKSLLEDFAPSNEMIYSEGSFRLAYNTRSLFEEIGKLDVLRASMKTNLFYQSTTSASDLYKLFSLVEEMGIVEESIKWAKQLVVATKPKLLVLEGYSVLTGLRDWVVPVDLSEMADGDTKTGKLWGIPYLCYKRVRSTICDRETVKELIDRNLGTPNPIFSRGVRC